MITVNITGENTYADKHLDQYDYGQILRMYGDLPSPVEVQFSLKKTGGEAPRRLGTEVDGAIEVEIPDEMLRNNDTTQNYQIYVFLYVRDETSGETTHRIVIPVKSRPKPGNYLPPEPKDYGEQLIASVMAEREKAETARLESEAWAHGHENYPENDKDNARYYAEQAKEVLKDAEKNIDEYVESKKESLKGEQGEPGEKGEPGTDGVDGYTPQKNIDYFDGKDGQNGTSVTVSSVTESTVDGGSNVVTFSDGKTLTVKNGTQGSKGDPGEQGPQGDPGLNGKSAYEYAREGGYTGTEEEFNQKLAADLQLDATLKDNTKAAPAGLVGELKGDLSDKLPKSPVNWEQWTAEESAAARERMNAQEKYRHIATLSVDEEGIVCVGIDTDENGNTFNLQDICIYAYLAKNTYACICAVGLNTKSTTINGSNNIIKIPGNLSNECALEININKRTFWRASIISSVGAVNENIAITTGYSIVSHRGASAVRANEWDRVSSLSIACDAENGFGIGTKFDIWGR